MEKNSFVFAFVLVANCFTKCVAQRSESLSSDESDLHAFRSHITSYPNEFFSNWSQNASFCNWDGVSCNINQRVMALNFSGLSLVGTIAPHLGNLTFLSSIDISNNNFSGSIPNELASLHGLKEINFGFNNLSGEVPAWFGTLPELRHLVLSNNNFTGFIPPSLGNISKLQTMYISSNFLEGNIPPEMGNLSMLRKLSFRENQLSGSIPWGIFNISSLEGINLGWNNLSGILPVDTCNNLPNLKGLYLSYNHFDGPIPKDLYKCRKLEQLSLSFNQITGRIPRELGDLKNLKDLYIGGNFFSGEIPKEIANLTQITQLDIQDSFLTGEIPAQIFNISSLRSINLSNNSLSGSLSAFLHHNLPILEKLILGYNHLTGPIPSFIWECKNLVTLLLTENNFTGGIPRSVGNLTSLQFLQLGNNRLTGQLPGELGNIGNLVQLSISINGLSGRIPPGIFNISSLRGLDFQSNNLRGPLPSNMWSTLPNIELAFFSGNELAGTFPRSIANATKLSMLDMMDNGLTGSIPSDIGNLRRLTWLVLGGNNLTRESTSEELKFITSLTNCRELEVIELSLNQFNGYLPSSIGNLSSSIRVFNIFNSKITGTLPSEIVNMTGLQSINMDSNQLTGFIPASLGKMPRLDRIYLENNRLQGFIPLELCELKNLGDLYLNDNMLSGPLPDCLGELKSLRRVYLQSNNFTSRIPSSFWNLKDLLELNLSSNSFSGNITQEIQNLNVISKLDLSWNQLSGDVPSSLGSSLSLVSLSLAHNKFEGQIPLSLGNLISLESLDLSQNEFSGTIPSSLEKLQYLKVLNLSFNTLEGEIPTGGSFVNFTAQSFLHNYALCGSARYKIKPCSLKASRESRVRLLKYILPPVTAAVVLTLATITYLSIRRRKSMGQPSNEMEVLHEWKLISYYELVKATNSFSEDNLIGTGSFGSVYKETLSDRSVVAVKVFHMQSEAANKSFEAECEVLGSIRHRNLVRILSCCSNLDFKALVLDYLPNGSLEMWLHSDDNRYLDLSQRLNIAIDIAFALEYLHHDHAQPVVHCDLKPSNILLDAGMNAHLCDFSISKLFDEGETMAQTKTLATVGYMAPEYGSEGIVSTSGDVYSYGIILLEMFTKKKPTDDIFGEGLNLKDWVNESIQQNSIMVVDSSLIRIDDEHFPAEEECLLTVLHVAIDCLANSPQERINMRDIVGRLQKFPWFSMEYLCNASTRFKLPLLSHFPVSHLPTVNGSSFSVTSMYSSLAKLPFYKPRISQRKRHHILDFWNLRWKFSVPALAKNSDGASSDSGNTKVVILSSLVTVALAVANRVLYKLALVPMKEYPFFLAQLNTFGYVVIYSSILYARYKAGIVTDEMMGLPKARFMMIGFLEALGVLSGMSSGAMLPGPAIPLLNQTFLVWQLCFSSLILGRKYSLNKLMGCLLVAAGVVLAVLSGPNNPNNVQMLSGIGLIWPLLMIASCAFQAGASIIKESVFLDAARRLKGRSVDIFVVNSFGSGFQALFVLLFLPVLSNMKGIPFSQLPSYFKSGAGCFLNAGFDVTGCDGAPLLPLLYIFFNLCFNISILHLVKISSAVVSSLAATSSVPISIYILSLPLPYLPEGVRLSPSFHLGSIVLLVGLFLYNMPQTPKVKSDM